MASKQNPLEISLILSEIFKKLNVEDQKSFRLVSKIWMDSTLGHWRGSSALIVITNGTYYDFGAFLRLVKKGNGQFYRIEEFPFRQFKIVRRSYVFKMDGEMRFQTPGEKTFYQLVGPEIEYLEFNQCAFESFLAFEGLKWIMLNFGLGNLNELVFTKTQLHLPRQIYTQADLISKSKINTKSKIKYALPAAENLKTLKLDGFYIFRIGSFWQHKGQIDLKDVIDIVPNLKNLFLDNSDNQLLIALHANACDSEKQVKLESLILEHVSLDSEAYAALEKYVEVAKPPLKKLQIELPTNRKEALYFHRFLEGCANTLACLKLKFSPREERPDFHWLSHLTGRAFPNLTHLHLVFYQSFLECSGKFDFEAFRGMPSLRSFTCVRTFPPKEINKTLSTEELLNKGSSPFMGTQISRNCIEEIEMNQLQDFHYCLSNKFGTESLQMIGGWMKNLKGLKLVLDEKAFEIIPEVFPSLEKLTLLRGSTVGEDTIQKARANRSFYITVEEAEIESESESSSEDSQSLADRNEEADRYRAEQKKLREERAAAGPVRRSQRIKKS